MKAHWEKIIDAVGKDLHETLSRRTNKTLRALVDAPEKLTQTNCWWLSYRLRDVVAQTASDILHSREHVRKLKADAKKGGG